MIHCITSMIYDFLSGSETGYSPLICLGLCSFQSCVHSFDPSACQQIPPASVSPFIFCASSSPFRIRQKKDSTKQHSLLSFCSGASSLSRQNRYSIVNVHLVCHTGIMKPPGSNPTTKFCRYPPNCLNNGYDH